MTTGARPSKLLDTSGVGYTLDDLPRYDDQPRIDPRTWFGDSGSTQPFQLEIGSGKGTFLVQQAAAQPDVNFLGIEYAGEFYRYAADRLRRHGLANVKLLHADAVDFVRYRLPDALCSVIHVYFPDPWPKRRHHKRRLIQDRMLAEFHRVLIPAENAVNTGEVCIVTDHEDYWNWIREHIERNTHLFDAVPFDRPESAGDGELVGTNFERKYRREGRPFHAIVLRRRDKVDDTSA